jgi:tRNA pseudouridine-54 N-methylase
VEHDIIVCQTKGRWQYGKEANVTMANWHEPNTIKRNLHHIRYILEMSSIKFKYRATDYCNLAAERVLTGIYVRNNHRECVCHKLKRQTLKVTIIDLFF